MTEETVFILALIHLVVAEEQARLAELQLVVVEIPMLVSAEQVKIIVEYLEQLTVNLDGLPVVAAVQLILVGMQEQADKEVVQPEQITAKLLQLQHLLIQVVAVEPMIDPTEAVKEVLELY